MRNVASLEPYGACAQGDGSPAWAVEYLEKLPDMLTPKQVAQTLSISARSARELCAAGALVGAFKLGSTWRIPKGAIAHLLASGGIQCGSIRDLERREGGDWA